MDLTLYKTKVKDLAPHVLGQLVRLNRGVDGNMVDVLVSKPHADVYYWKKGTTVVSWASVHNTRTWLQGKMVNIKEVNLYTHKDYRKMGFGSETVDYIKKDFPKQFENDTLCGHGSCTSIIEKKELRDI